MDRDIAYLTQISIRTGQYLETIEQLLVDWIRPGHELYENFRGISERHPGKPDLWAYALSLQVDTDERRRIARPFRSATESFLTGIQEDSCQDVSWHRAVSVVKLIQGWAADSEYFHDHEDAFVVGGDLPDGRDIYINWMPTIRLAFAELGMHRPTPAA